MHRVDVLLGAGRKLTCMADAPGRGRQRASTPKAVHARMAFKRLEGQRTKKVRGGRGVGLKAILDGFA